jgi:hypothetical protein
LERLEFFFDWEFAFQTVAAAQGMEQALDPLSAELFAAQKTFMNQVVDAAFLCPEETGNEVWRLFRDQ